MNKPLTLALVYLPVGFVAGWIAKPSTDVERPAPVAETLTKTQPSQLEQRPTSFSSPRESVTKPPMSSTMVMSNELGEMDPEMQKMIEDAQSQQMKAVRKGQANKFDMRIAAMVRELGLDANQEAALREFFDEQLKKIDPSSMMGTGSPEQLAEMAAALRGDGLKEFMADHLTEEQLKGLDRLEERKRTSKIEANALKNLAKVQQSLDLNEDQKDKIYEIFMEDAAEKLKSQSDSSLVTQAMMSNMGVNIDLEDMGLDSMMDVQDMGDGAMDPASIGKMMADSRQRKIDQKVERLSSVLDENQQEQYRKSLENKGSAFNMLIQGADQ